MGILDFRFRISDLADGVPPGASGTDRVLELCVKQLLQAGEKRSSQWIAGFLADKGGLMLGPPFRHLGIAFPFPRLKLTRLRAGFTLLFPLAYREKLLYSALGNRGGT